MFKTLPVDCSKLLFSRLDKAARKTKFVIQKSLKFSTAGSLFALINAILTGRASFNQLAMGLKHREPFSLTKQAVWKRTNALALDLIVELGESGYKARLIAIRATKEVAKRTRARPTKTRASRGKRSANRNSCVVNGTSWRPTFRARKCRPVQ